MAAAGVKGGIVGGGRGRGAKYRHLYEEAQARCLNQFHGVRNFNLIYSRSESNFTNRGFHQSFAPALVYSWQVSALLASRYYKSITVYLCTT